MKMLLIDLKKKYEFQNRDQKKAGQMERKRERESGAEASLKAGSSGQTQRPKGAGKPLTMALS